MDNYIDLLKTNPVLAIFLYMTVYTLAMPFWVPATFLILFGAYSYGNAFGFVAGFVIFTFVDYICLMVGVYLAFLNGKYLFRNCVQTWIQTRPKLLALSEALSHNAKKLVFLLRLWNLTPYYVFNYICSVTNMTHVDYLIGNLSIIFWDAPYIYVCASLTDISKVENSSENLGYWYYVIIGISVVIMVVVIIAIYFFARRELKKTLAGIQDKQAQSEGDNENVKNLPQPAGESDDLERQGEDSHRPSEHSEAQV